MRNVHFSDLGQVLAGCRAGDLNRQRQLYEYFYGYGMSISLRYAGNREAAAEILNDTFFKVFTGLDKYDDRQPFKPWFRRILINAAINHLRKEKKLPVFTDLSDLHDLADDLASLPEISPDEDMLPILAELSPAYRTVFNLYVMEEYSHREIGEMLGIGESTSRANLARAIAHLKKILTEKKPRPANPFAADKKNRDGKFF